MQVVVPGRTIPALRATLLFQEGSCSHYRPLLTVVADTGSLRLFDRDDHRGTTVTPGSRFAISSFCRPLERSIRKKRNDIDELCRAFITPSPFLLMATAGSDGKCDVSPKGDAAGFVKVLDEKRLIIPERNATSGWME